MKLRLPKALIVAMAAAIVNSQTLCAETVTINENTSITGNTYSGKDVVVSPGTTLTLSNNDCLGWDNNRTLSITLAGTDSQASGLSTLALNGRQTQTTNINLNGHSRVTSTKKTGNYANDGGFDAFGDATNTGLISATGTDNIISANIYLRKDVNVNVAGGGELEVSGYVGKRDTLDDVFNGLLTKNGAGTLTISGSGNRFYQRTGSKDDITSGGVINKAGTTVFTGSDNILANLKVDGGAVSVRGQNASVQVYHELSVASGAEFSLGGDGTLKVSSGGSVTNSGTMTLAGSLVDGCTINNSGSLSVAGATLAVNGLLEGFRVSGEKSFTSGANGFIRDTDFYLASGSGSVAINGATILVNGAEATARTTDSGDILFHVNTDSGTYYINEGTLTYNETDMGSASHLFIAEGALLNANGNPSSSKTLSGSGTYAVTDWTKPSNISISDTSWTGIARVTRNISSSDGRLDDKIAKWANSGSKVELNGVNGWLGGNVGTNLILTGTGEGGTGGAVKISDGSSGAEREFSGSVAGAGDFIYAWTGGTSNTTSTQTHHFSGDVAAWTGNFRSENASGQLVGLKFSGAATTINAGVVQAGTRALTVTFTNSSAVTMNGTIGKSGNNRGAITLIADANVTFTKAVTADTLTINSGKTATFNSASNMTIGTITGAGNLTKMGTGKLELSGAQGEYSGTTTIAAGTLQIDNSSNNKQHSFGAVSLGQGATLQSYYGSYDTATYDSYKTELGTVTLTGDAATIAALNHGGLTSIAGISGTGTLTLKNAAQSTVHTTFSIGGTATDATQTSFHGTLDVWHSDAGDQRGTVVVFNDEFSAADAVLAVTAVATNTKNNKRYNRVLGIGLNSETVKLKGINDGTIGEGGVKSQYLIFSGSGENLDTVYDDTKSYFAAAADDEVRTLELTGDGTYSTAAKVGANINITMNGTGTQTFSGDMSDFNGSVSVNSGHLKMGQAVTIQNLTVAENAKYTVAGGTTQIESELTQSGSIVVENNAVLDLTALADDYFGKDVQYQSSHASRFAALVEKTTGEGTVKLKGMTIQFGDDHASYSGTSLTFKTNYEFGANLNLANYSKTGANSFHWIVGSQDSEGHAVNGSIKVHNDTGTAKLTMKNGQTLEIKANGSVEADKLELGQSGSYASYLTMSGGSLKTGTVTSYGASTFSVTGGTVEFTDADAFGNNTSATVTLNGATLKATDTAWKADGSKLQSLTIGNLTINDETQNSITLSNAKTTTQVRTITNNASGTGKLVLDNLEFDERLNINGNGTTEFVNGATLGTGKTNGFSLVANTDVILKGNESGGKATYNLAGTDVAIQQNKTLYIRSGAELTAAKFYYTSSPYGKIVLDAGATLKSNDLLRLQHITNNGSVLLTSNNEKTVSSYSQGSTGVLELGDNVWMDTSKDANGSIEGSFKLGSGAQLNIKNLGAEVSASLKDLTLAQNATMGVYTDGTKNATAEGGISVSGTLSTGSGATLNANLTLNNGATLAVAEGGLHMGSTLTIANDAKVSLSDNIISGLNSLTVGNGLTLFSGVDSFTLDGTEHTENFTSGSASNYFNLAGVNRPWDFVIKYETPAGSTDGGTVSLWMETPEPATATLSLLALAALAARRKRK